MSEENDMGTPTPITGLGIDPTPVEQPVEEPGHGLPAPQNLGWVNDPEAVDEIASLQPFVAFADTPAGEVSLADLPPEVFIWKIHKLVTGKDPDEENQGNYGSCVGFGTVAAVEASMVMQIYSGAHEEWKELCQEVVYGGSRIEIGKGRLGRGQGSIGAWAAEYVKQYGILPRGKYGSYDLSKYSIPLCDQFGNKGVPDDLEKVSKVNPVQEITKVKSWESAKKALAQGYGIAICSNRGFSSMKRDEYGFCKASGVWNHCMALWGYQTGPREGGWIKNSWGPNATTGPRGAGEPPLCGFWAEASVIDGMLRQGDSWAFSAIKGFPKQKVDVIDWSSL